jgi:beta-glucanase (GH16 family)
MADWQIQNGKNGTKDLSDEFDSKIIDKKKWQVFDCRRDTFYAAWGTGTGFCEENACLSQGFLYLKASGDTICCGKYNNTQGSKTKQYRTGGIQSQYHSYSGGYIEVKAKFPGYSDATGGRGEKFWPAIWTYFHLQNGECISTHDEIDLVDQCCDEYYDTKTIGSGINKWNGKCKFNGYGWIKHNTKVDLFENFHKYAVEWDSAHYIFYFDDKPYNYYETKDFKFNPMRLVMDLQINPDTGWCNNPRVVKSFPPGEEAKIPFAPKAFAKSSNSAMIIDYIRYYKPNYGKGKKALPRETLHHQLTELKK